MNRRHHAWPVPNRHTLNACAVIMMTAGEYRERSTQEHKIVLYNYERVSN